MREREREREREIERELERERGRERGRGRERERENEDARERERAVSIIRQNNDRFPFIIWCYKKVIIYIISHEGTFQKDYGIIF